MLILYAKTLRVFSRLYGPATRSCMQILITRCADSSVYVSIQRPIAHWPLSKFAGLDLRAACFCHRWCGRPACFVVLVPTMVPCHCNLLILSAPPVCAAHSHALSLCCSTLLWAHRLRQQVPRTAAVPVALPHFGFFCRPLRCAHLSKCCFQLKRTGTDAYTYRGEPPVLHFPMNDDDT